MTPVQKSKQSKLSLGNVKQGDTNPVAGPKKGGGVSVNTSLWNMADDNSAQKDYPKKGTGGTVNTSLFKEDHTLEATYKK